MQGKVKARLLRWTGILMGGLLVASPASQAEEVSAGGAAPCNCHHPAKAPEAAAAKAEGADREPATSARSGPTRCPT